MILLKSFFRKKVTKVYLIILCILIISYFLLSSLIVYFTDTQNEIYSKYSEIVVINNFDIYDKLSQIKDVKNIERILAFKENKDYKIFRDANYEIYDSNENLVDSQHNEGNKIMWEVMEREQLEDYVIVYPASRYGYELKDDEIIMAINDFWYDSYEKSSYNKIINQKIGFFYNNQNIEFNICDVIKVNMSSLLISDNLYNELIEKKDLFVYTAKASSLKSESKVKQELKEISNEDSYIFSVASYYKDDASDRISSLYDLLDILKLASYLSLFVFLIVLFIIIKNIINDSKKNYLINRKLGFNKNQIKIEILKELLVLFMLSALISILCLMFLIILINAYFSIKLSMISIKSFMNLIIVVIIINFATVMLSSFKIET